MSKRVYLSRVVAVLLLPAIPSVVMAADEFRQLKGPEISTKLVGQEFTDEVHWAQVFERDGRLRTVSMGTAHTGTWRRQKNELCLTESSDSERCYQVWAAGNRIEMRRDDGTLPDAGILRKPQPRR